MKKNYIYNNLSVSVSSITNTIQSVLSTGKTYNGKLDASFIGNGTSLITNSNFHYLTGLTDYIQTQLNNKLTTTPKVLNFTNNTNIL